jgi:hypothetical protein
MSAPPRIQATTIGHGPNRASSRPWSISTNRRQKRASTARIAPNWMAMA